MRSGTTESVAATVRTRRRSHSSLEVEAPDCEAALALIHALKGAHAEVSPIDRNRCLVTVELTNRPTPDRALCRILDTVDAWLVDRGIASAGVSLAGKRYVMTLDGARSAAAAT